MKCGCWKWGHFRQHCAKEYRTGETCGMKLVMNRYSLEDKCRICTKIATKERAINKEYERIRRWQKESNRKASIEKSHDEIYRLQGELDRLINEKQVKNGNMNSSC